MFTDPRAISIYDEVHSKKEERWITLGMSSSLGLIVVCHTFEWTDSSNARIRIFSSRKATKGEISQYSEKI